MKINSILMNKKIILIGSLCAILLCSVLSCDKPSYKNEYNEWSQVEAIIKQITVPTFPQREYIITHFGAKGDSVTDCHSAFYDAIKKCNIEGGGSIVVPEGIYLVNGPIHLKSNVNLFVSEGARIKFSGNPDHYLPVVLTRWEGTELYNYSPLIYAYQATNVAITGKGIIDGNARTSFAEWKPKQKKAQAVLRQMGNDCVPVNERVFGKNYWLRPSMIQPFGCKNVLIEGITIIDSPFWIIHPTYCMNVAVKDVTIESWNPNNDGCDPDASVNVLIENCVFNTGDDGIAIKSGRDQDGWRVGQGTENVVIRSCIFNSKANGLAIGSEMSGSVRNVFIEDCQVGEANSAIYFKANLDRGGMIENVFLRNIQVNRANTAFIRFESNYKGHRGNHYPPIFRKFQIENVTCQFADHYGIYAVGVKDSPITDVILKDVTITNARVPTFTQYVSNAKLSNVKINGSIVSDLPFDEIPQESNKAITW